MRETMWEFKTAQFRIVATIEPDFDLDLSWDDSGETRAKLDSGEWQSFGTRVTVYFRGCKIAEDSLWESIYADPREFFTAHRDADPMNRNCSIMRAARGDNACICHYFPDMVRIAITSARDALSKAPRIVQ